MGRVAVDIAGAHLDFAIDSHCFVNGVCRTNPEVELIVAGIVFPSACAVPFVVSQLVFELDSGKGGQPDFLNRVADFCACIRNESTFKIVVFKAPVQTGFHSQEELRNDFHKEPK